RPLRDQLPGHQVRVVFHLGQQDDIARLQVGAAPAGGDEVDRFRRAARKDDLGGIGGVDESSDPRAGALVGLGGAIGEGVQAPVDVGVVALVEVRERVDHDLRLLGGGRVVE